MAPIHPDYPTPDEVDAWCEALITRAQARQVTARFVEDPIYDFRLGVRHTGGCYVVFESPDAEPFYGFWQPAPAGRGPLLFHLPGYGAEISAHPELVSQGYSVLHINPLGYATPAGPDAAKQVNGAWPVLPDTASSMGRAGYVDWLADAIAAVHWARQEQARDADRYGFFGTSQGGGTALLLASILSRQGVGCVAADLPFLVNFPLASERVGWVREITLSLMKGSPDSRRAAWKALGYVDVLCHAHRLGMPVLLTAGSQDETCPPETISGLFDRLPGTRSYTEIAGQGHAYTKAFLHLAQAWFRLHL